MKVKNVNATPAAKVSLRIASQVRSTVPKYDKYLVCLAFWTAPAKKQAPATMKDTLQQQMKVSCNSILLQVIGAPIHKTKALMTLGLTPCTCKTITCRPNNSFTKSRWVSMPITYDNTIFSLEQLPANCMWHWAGPVTNPQLLSTHKHVNPGHAYGSCGQGQYRVHGHGRMCWISDRVHGDLRRRQGWMWDLVVRRWLILDWPYSIQAGEHCCKRLWYCSNFQATISSKGLLNARNGQHNVDYLER